MNAITNINIRMLLEFLAEIDLRIMLPVPISPMMEIIPRSSGKEAVIV